MSTIVDKVAAAAFIAFVAVEWQVADELTAWKLRLLWVIVSLGAILLVHRRECEAFEEEKREHETTLKASKAKSVSVQQSSIVQFPSVEVPIQQTPKPKEDFPNSSLLVESPDQSSIVRSPSHEEILTPSMIPSKKKSFVKRTVSTLFSPLRSRSSRSLKQKAEDRETSSAVHSPDASLDSSAIKMGSGGIEASDSAKVHEPDIPEAQRVQEKASTPPMMVLDAFGYGPDAVKPPSSFTYVRTNNWGYLGHLDAMQTEALNKFRAFNFACVESQGPTPSLKIDDETLLRFLRARKFDIEKARRMLEAHLAWRDKFLPSKLTPNDISSVLGSGLTRFGPYSKEGLPSTIIKVEFFEPSKFDGDVDLFTRYVAFFFERALNRLPQGADKGILLYDMRGWSLRKHATRFSLKLVAELINIIQAHNPERLDKCILFNTPLVFSGTWSLIKGLLDPVVADKVKFVSDTSVMLTLFEKEELPVEYGGERTLPYPIEGFAELHTSS